MANILRFINNVIDIPIYQLSQYYKGNRIVAQGKSFEMYVKHMFCGTINSSDEEFINSKINETFSYLGNDRNPPDLILRNGDAIEIKKKESGNAIQLNSSSPGDCIYADSHMLSKKCKRCEDWSVKDLIYIVGSLNKKKEITSIWCVYGNCFCLHKNKYEEIFNTIKESIYSINSIKLSQTDELGKVIDLDLAGTALRVRGMWIIPHFSKIFDSLECYKNGIKFQLHCILKSEKFSSFPQEDIDKLYNNNKAVIRNIQIADPNNPKELLDAKLVSFYLQG